MTEGGELLAPGERLERTLKMRVKGHQTLLLRWEFDPEKGHEVEVEYGARPATKQEGEMWDRLLLLEKMINSHHREEERAINQVRRLADWIITNVPGEPSRSEGAVDVAIRIMGDAKSYADSIADREAAQKRPGPTHGESAEPRRG